MTRLITALRLLFLKRVLVIEVTRCRSEKKDRITLVGTMEDEREQVKILRELASSIEVEYQAKELVRLRNTKLQTN